MRQMVRTIKAYCPRLFELMDALPDNRRTSTYTMAEIITGCLAMYLLKETSRNALDHDRQNAVFRTNYQKIFKKRLPHMDTADNVITQLSQEELESLKAAFITGLIEHRALHRFKLFGKYFMVAIDGTGINSYKENNEEQNLTSKTSKNGLTTFFSHVVEAKLVTSSGLSISIASEWVINQLDNGTIDLKFNKQDCELRAFQRLSKSIKKYYPRLSICILADGLYPNQTFMKTCQDNGWAYIVVFKDKSLNVLQEDIKDVENKNRHSLGVDIIRRKGRECIHQKYEWISEPLTHAGHTVYWLSCTETISYRDKNLKVISVEEPTRFVNLTNIKVDKDNVRGISNAGRMRWKIENEGFNTQKNGGYCLGHKYSRDSFTAYKNYYQCMQIAHIINQLVEKSTDMAALQETDSKLSIKQLWTELMSWLRCCIVDPAVIELNERKQIRLAG